MSKDKQSYGPLRAPPVISAWDAFVPEAGAPCLFANGFIVVDEYPHAPQYPYLVLAPLMGTSNGSHFGVGLYLTPDASRHALQHPSDEGRDVGELVNILAVHLASTRFTSDTHGVGVLEGPLPIYIIDPAWKPTAERFVAEYGRPVSGDLSSK